MRRGPGRGNLGEQPSVLSGRLPDAGTAAWFGLCRRVAHGCGLCGEKRGRRRSFDSFQTDLFSRLFPGSAV